MISNWQPEHFPVVKALLIKHGTLEPSVRVIHQFLDRARRALRVLPASAGATGLRQMADFIAQQTGALTVQSECQS
jgi:geranylgeranyl pyrophosphate synthase